MSNVRPACTYLYVCCTPQKNREETFARQETKKKTKKKQRRSSLSTNPKTGQQKISPSLLCAVSYNFRHECHVRFLHLVSTTIKSRIYIQKHVSIGPTPACKIRQRLLLKTKFENNLTDCTKQSGSKHNDCRVIFGTPERAGSLRNKIVHFPPTTSTISFMI